MFLKLHKKYVNTTNENNNGYQPPVGSGPTVYMDIRIGDAQIGRITYTLFADKTPIASETI